MKRMFAGASALVLGVAMAGAVQAAEAADAAEIETVIVTGTRTTGLRAVDSHNPQRHAAARRRHVHGA